MCSAGRSHWGVTGQRPPFKKLPKLREKRGENQEKSGERGKIGKVISFCNWQIGRATLLPVWQQAGVAEDLFRNHWNFHFLEPLKFSLSETTEIFTFWNHWNFHFFKPLKFSLFETTEIFTFLSHWNFHFLKPLKFSLFETTEIFTFWNHWNFHLWNHWNFHFLKPLKFSLFETTEIFTFWNQWNFHFLKPLQFSLFGTTEICFGATKMKISTGRKHFTSGNLKRHCRVPRRKLIGPFSLNLPLPGGGGH